MPERRDTPVTNSLSGEVDFEGMARVLGNAARSKSLVLVVHTPGHLSRISLYQALDQHIVRWGRRRTDVGAFIDLSNHPALPAQTIIGSEVQTWNDLADGLPQALAGANILIVLGLEQMLADTPHRLAAFLEARARHQVVVVLTPLAQQVRQLHVRETLVHVDESLAHESDLVLIARSVAHTAISAARQTARRAPARARPGRLT